MGAGGRNIKIFVAAAAASAALLACSDRQSATGNSDSAVAPAAAPAAADVAYRERFPAAPYRAYFEERYPVPPKSVSAAEVSEMLERQGPQRTVAALWGEDGEKGFESAMRGIAMGEPDWLKLAPRLAPGLDAGASTSFAMAAQDALTTNAAGGLQLMSRLSGASCLYESYEAPPEQTRAFNVAAIAAVEAVDDPALRTVKAKCLTQLRSDVAR